MICKKKHKKTHKKHKSLVKQQAVKLSAAENKGQYKLNYKLLEEHKKEFLDTPSLQLDIAQSLLLSEDIMGLKLLLKLDIGEKCLIEALETTPMTNVLAAMSTLLYKFFKQENLVQICNIIDECRNQTPIFKQQWNNGSISKRKDIRDTTQKKIIEDSNNQRLPSKDSSLIQNLFFKALWANNEVLTKQHFTKIIDKLDKTLATKHGIDYVLNSISQCFVQCPEPFSDKIINAFLDAGDYKRLIEYYNVMANHAGDHYILSDQIKYAWLAYNMISEETKNNLEEQFFREETGETTYSPQDLLKQTFSNALYNLCIATQEFNALYATTYLQQINERSLEKYNKLILLQPILKQNFAFELKNVNSLHLGGNIKLQKKVFTLNCSKTMSELLQGIKLQLKKNNDLKISTNTCLELIETAMQNSPELQEEQSMLLYHYMVIFNNHKSNKEEVITAISKMLLLQEAVPKHLQNKFSLSSQLIYNTIKIIISDDFLNKNFNFSTSILNLFLHSDKLSSDMLEMFNNLDEQRKCTMEAKLLGDEKYKQLPAEKLDEKDASEPLIPKTKELVKQTYESNQDKIIPLNDNLTYFEINMLIETGNQHLISFKSWHKYFTINKKILMQNYIDEQQPQEQENNTFWTVDNQHKYSAQCSQEFEYEVTKVEKLNKNYTSNNYYAVILPETAELLEEQELILCKNALSGGIKFIKNSGKHCIVELCIQMDLRLATNTIYKNSAGSFLIVFDKKLDHVAIKNNLAPLQFIELLDDLSQDINLLEKNDDIDISGDSGLGYEL